MDLNWGREFALRISGGTEFQSLETGWLKVLLSMVLAWEDEERREF